MNNKRKRKKKNYRAVQVTNMVGAEKIVEGKSEQSKAAFVWHTQELTEFLWMNGSLTGCIC
jgi:hypothetical protein